MVKVSVVIVNYNGAKIVPVILDSLKKSRLKGGFETIVVDNASTDESIRIIRKYRNVKIVKNKVNLGYTGVNSALQYCKGEYIYFTNNDLALDKNCLAELAEVLDKNESFGVACSKVINYYDKKLQSCGTWVSRCYYNGHFMAEKDYPKQIPYNGVAMVRKSIAEKFGYIFDKDYFIYAEDLDLCLRTRLLGYKVIHVPTAIIHHMHSTTMGKGRKYRSTFLMERNLLATFFKIFTFGNTLLFLPYVLLMRFVGMIKDILTLDFQSALARISAILYVIFNFAGIMKKRAQVQKMRKADDKFILEVFSEKYLFSKDRINV